MGCSALRGIVAALGAIMAAAAVLGLALGLPVWGALLVGIVVVATAVFEPWRYKRLETEPPPGFEPTAERFLDQDTRAPVTVYVDPATGERRYVRSDRKGG